MRKPKRSKFPELVPLREQQTFLGMPRRVGDVINDLMVRRGYSQIESLTRCQEAWEQAVGPILANHCLSGNVRRGVLQVVVRNSTVLQEISLRKPEFVQRLSELVPEFAIKDLRLRVGKLNTPS